MDERTVVRESALARAIRRKVAADGASLAAVERRLGLGRGTLSCFFTGHQYLSTAECKKLAPWLGWTQRAVLLAHKAMREEIRANRQAEKARDMALVDLDGVSFPFQVLNGVLYRPPLEVSGGCEQCEFAEECQRSVLAGDFALCERVIARELLPRRLDDGRECIRVPEEESSSPIPSTA